MDPRLNLASACAVFVALACAGVVASRASSAPRPQASPAATPEQKAMFAANIASEEEGWRTATEKDFPGDQWSQRDAFHGHEAESVRNLAGSSHVSLEDVIRAVDDDVRKSRRRGREQDRSANAIPCKPRPFYD